MFQRQLTAMQTALDGGEWRRVLDASRDALGEYLDAANPGRSYRNSDFAELPQRFEREYHQDMESLNVSGGCLGV